MWPNIPKELLHIILEYDGRIKYKKGEYVNIIHKRDPRYEIVKKDICRKIEIRKEIIQIENSPRFYFEIFFKNIEVGLSYDYCYSVENKFEICYADFRNDIIQIRTYL